MRSQLKQASSVWSLLRQVQRTVTCMAGQLVAHGDLKPENCLVTFDDFGRPLAKVSDFGTARLCNPTASVGGYTTPFAGPEIFSTPHPTIPDLSVKGFKCVKSDVFSCAVQLIVAVKNYVPVISMLAPSMSKIALAMLNPDTDPRPSSAVVEHRMDYIHIELADAYRLPEADILTLLARSDDPDDPWHAEADAWGKMIKFVGWRVRLDQYITDASFVSGLDADAVIIAFRDVGWDLGHLKRFLYGVAEDNLPSPNAYARLVGLDEKLNEAFARLGPAGI